MTIRVNLSPGGKALGALAANVLVAAGALALAVSAWALLSGALYQRVQKIRFAEELPVVEDSGVAHDSAAPESTVSAPPARPRRFGLLAPDPLVIGQLRIARIGLDVMVREGIDEGTLRRAAGHVPSTALPGQTGDFVVLGHRDTFFRPLRAVERGDVVRMRTRHGQFTYRIDSVEVVDLEGLRAIRTASREAITLITCFPFDYVGPAPRRLIARGRSESEP